MGEITSLTFAEYMGIDGQDCARIVAEVLGDFVNWRPQPEPSRGRVVTEGMPAKPEGELSGDSDLQLPSLLVQEEVVAMSLSCGMSLEDLHGAW